MISLLDKQKVILKSYRDRKSQRAIQRETGISRKTIRKYIKEYEEQQKELINIGADSFSGEELIQSLVEKPRYDCSSRQKVKLTQEMMERIKYYLKENENKRATGRSKQQKKKIDIHEELLKEGFDISYSSVCNTVRLLEKNQKEAYIKQDY